RRVFADFDAARLATWDDARLEAALLDPGIVRNRLKVWSVRTNAKAFLAVQKEFGSFDAYLWNWVQGKPLLNAWTELREVPARTESSDALSTDLLKRGFKFVGSTIMYAYMQAMGLVNDHLQSCHRNPAHDLYRT
ncbi:MAG: DNA-3-methyladenine glycosylase I, partial [Panacagrimonas sp.]